MNRSLYPEGTEVHQRHLANTESTKAAAINEVVSDVTTRGVSNGLQVTVTSPPNNTKINIAAGSGYANNGEFMTLAVGQTGVSLADQSLNAVNYVLLMYDEVYSSPESHETDGTTRDTVATVSPRVVVLTATQYLALPSTDPVLTNNAIDRSLIIAIVTANGTGIALTGGSIQSPTSFQTTLVINQPTNITGVVITSIDTSTPTGTGTLSFTAAGQQLTWQAPGESSPGAPVTVSASALYTLTSFTGHTMVVNVSSTLLPLTNKTDSISVTNVYTQQITRFTANDYLHRSYVGSGIPTVKNPHGLTLADLSPSGGTSLNEHQNLEHANGIVRTSSPNALSCSVFTPPAPDQISVTALGAGDTAYVRGFEIKSIVGSTTVTFLDGTLAAGLYGIFLSQDGTLQKSLRASYPVSSLLSNKTFIVNVSPGIGTATKSLQWTSGGQISFDGGTSKSAPASSDTMLRLFSSDNVNFVDVWVKAASTPGSTQTDSITFFNNLDLTQVLQLCYVPWAGSASGFLGYGFGLANAPNFVFDTRLFGTTSLANLRDDVGPENVSRAIRDLLGDGIYVRTDLQTTSTSAYNSEFSLGVLSGLSIPVGGGVVFVGGVRLDVVGTSLSLTDNATNLIYVNSQGALQTSTLTQAQLQASLQNQPFILLWSETITAGSETGRSDLRTYTGQKRNVPFGAVALDVNASAQITAQPNTTANVNGLIVQGAGTNSSLLANGSTAGGDAIHAYAQGGNGWGIDASGFGTGVGVNAIGGSGGAYGVLGTGTGLFQGVKGIGGSGGSAGVWGQGTLTAPGIVGTGAGYVPQGGSGVVGGLFVAGGGSGGDGISAWAFGNGHSGVYGQGGNDGGAGLWGQGGNNGGPGISATGGSNGPGALFQGGTGAGVGLQAIGTGPANGAQCYGSGVGSGVYGQGGNSGDSAGSGVGVHGQGGTGGVGIQASPGSGVANNWAIRSEGNIDMVTTNPSVTTSSAQSFGGKTYTTNTKPLAWGIIETSNPNVVTILDGYNISSASVSSSTLFVNLTNGSTGQLGGSATWHSGSTTEYGFCTVSENSTTQLQVLVFSGPTGSAPNLRAIGTAVNVITVIIYGSPA